MNGKILLPIVLVGLVAPAHTAERVSLKVSPAVAFAPANIFVRATVDRNADNRMLEIIAESPEFYRSSEVSLDGDRAPRVIMLQFKSVPGGAYDVRAVLHAQDGHELAATETHLNVVDGSE
ncbi:MAG: hypothetical protein JSU08_17165 [Acidobacteria bacterium]|nr:hypothetical protein [Acidobacteriota bacterium]